MGSGWTGINQENCVEVKGDFTALWEKTFPRMVTLILVALTLHSCKDFLKSIRFKNTHGTNCRLCSGTHRQYSYGLNWFQVDYPNAGAWHPHFCRAEAGWTPAFTSLPMLLSSGSVLVFTPYLPERRQEAPLPTLLRLFISWAAQFSSGSSGKLLPCWCAFIRQTMMELDWHLKNAFTKYIWIEEKLLKNTTKRHDLVWHSH